MIARRFGGYLIAITTAALNYAVFYFVAKLLGSTIPHFIAGALLSAIVVHEIGHLLAFEANGIPAKMFFAVLIGGAAPFKGYESKFKQLSWSRQAGIMLAGVTGNFVVMLGAFLIYKFGYLTCNELLRVMSLNAILIFWNLVPVWIFDGGRFAKILFNSIDEKRDKRFVLVITVFFFVTVLMLCFFSDKFLIVNACLLFWGLHYQSKHDDPAGSYSQKAISRSHQKWWATLYVIMLIAAAVIEALTPVWLLNPKV